jgi:hypothetical protein
VGREREGEAAEGSRLPRGGRGVIADRKRPQKSGESSLRQGTMVEFKEVEQRPEDGTVDVDDALDILLSGVGERMLFEERPVGLTALFRFQTGSNIFDCKWRVGCR